MLSAWAEHNGAAKHSTGERVGDHLANICDLVLQLHHQHQWNCRTWEARSLEEGSRHVPVRTDLQGNRPSLRQALLNIGSWGLLLEIYRDRGISTKTNRNFQEHTVRRGDYASQRHRCDRRPLEASQGYPSLPQNWGGVEPNVRAIQRSSRLIVDF